MDLPNDLRELLALFNAHGVEYVVAGAHALAYHGAPRYTGDLDLLVGADPDNARRLMAALSEFGFADVGLTSKDFEFPNQVIQLGRPPVRVDLLTSLTGVTWEEARDGSESGVCGGVSVRFLGRAQFVANKRAAARKKDLADLDALGEA